MDERYIKNFRSIELTRENGEAELAGFRTKLPPRQARRMSPLGVLVSEALSGMPFTRDTAILYTTTFTESLALEAFLGSFPYPSPTYFQTSIHPGGIEQALILNQHPVTALYPLAGGAGILSHALRLACADDRPDVLIVAGEEAATWLADLDAASSRTFVWALFLAIETDRAMGSLTFTSPPSTAAKPANATFVQKSPSLHDFGRILKTRQKLDWDTAAGRFSLKWTG